MKTPKLTTKPRRNPDHMLRQKLEGYGPRGLRRLARKLGLKADASRAEIRRALKHLDKKQTHEEEPDDARAAAVAALGLLNLRELDEVNSNV